MTDSIFPFITATPVQAETKVLPLLKEYAWDFTTNTFALLNGKLQVLTGIEALKVWIYKALKTPRYIYLAYSWQYGQEFDNLIGGSQMSISAITSEVTRYVEETLLINKYIKNIKDVTVDATSEQISATFTVTTIYGEVVISV